MSRMPKNVQIEPFRVGVSPHSGDDQALMDPDSRAHSASSWPDELKQAMEIRARAGLAVADLVRQARADDPLDLRACWSVLREMHKAIQRNSCALVSLMRVKRHDEYGTMHAVAVGSLMLCLARELSLDNPSCMHAGLTGLLLDIGMAKVPAELINKPGVLSAEDFALVRKHVRAGHELLKTARDVPPAVLDAALCHHERLDGSGYPHGLSGADISPLARMAAICDVYDTVTSNRPYKHPWDPAEAVARMASWRGALDTELFDAFVRCVGLYPTGSLVRLKSQRLAVVIEQNPGFKAAPVVRVFFSIRGRQRISPQRLDLSEPGQADGILSRESAADWAVGNTDALWSHGFAAQLIGNGPDKGRASLQGPVRE